jgi:acetyl-CoA C-acetyltransferase
MAQKVAIVAEAQTKYEASKRNQNNNELIYEVVENVLQKTGLRFEDQVTDGFGIDKVVDCSEDFWQGRTISNIVLHPEMGAFALDETKVCADGTQAVYHATMDILSGAHEIVLVVAHRKESETLRSVVENCGFDSIYLQPLGFDFLAAAALQAKRYMYKYGLTQEQFAKVVVKNLKNARNNPYAQRTMDITVGDVLSSKMIAYPIKLLDAKPVADGACALILAIAEKAKRITDKPVWIRGLGNCYDAHYLGNRDLADCDSLVLAAKRAYQMAGITNPCKEVDVAEICDEYSYQELLWAEGLGLCDRGKGGELIDSGVTEIGCELPINPSGGLLSGVPSGVAGVSQVAEAFLQLRGEAGGRQVDGAKVALVQGATGACGQSHCVIILGR